MRNSMKRNEIGTMSTLAHARVCTTIATNAPTEM
jgi:hypothetical protein